MNKQLSNILNTVFFICLAGIFCGAYFLLCSESITSLICFISCLTAALISLLASLIAYNCEAPHSMFATIGIATVNGVYVTATVVLWVLFSLITASARTIIFIELTVLIIYIFTTASIIAFSWRQNNAEISGSVNLSTYTLCCGTLNDISHSIDNVEIQSEINSISEQIRYIKSGSFCISGEIIGEIFDIKNYTNGNINEQYLRQKLTHLKNSVDKFATTVKM